MPSLLLAQAWVSSHPDLARASVAAFVFLVMYTVRKLRPNWWLFFERMSPSLSAEMTWADEQVHKVWQAVPSALLGAVVSPMVFGGDIKQALLGMVTGLAAPFSHELLKHYEGKLGTGKQPPGRPPSEKPVGRADGAVDNMAGEAFDDVTPPSLPGAAMRGGGTIQNIEIVITSNQNPSKIARAVVKHIASLKTTRTVALLALLTVVVAMTQPSCSAFASAPIQPDVCSKVSLTTIVAGCDARAKECTPGDTTCPLYIECKKAIKTWRACS